MANRIKQNPLSGKVNSKPGKASKGSSFSKADLVSERSIEALVKLYGNNLLCLDHRHHYADCYLLKEGVYIEVKTHQNTSGYPTFPAEVYKNSFTNTVSDWLLSNNPVTYIYQIDATTSDVYVFDVKKLRAYCMNNLKSLRVFGKSDNAARGLLIRWESEEAGYLHSFTLKGDIND